MRPLAEWGQLAVERGVECAHRLPTGYMTELRTTPLREFVARHVR